MVDIHKELKCTKWQDQGGNKFKCMQEDSNPCGCWSNICRPKVELILSDQQKKDRAQCITHLKENIKNNSAALVLGAGISKPSKLPLWSELISKMMGYAIQYEFVGKQHFSVATVDTKVRESIIDRTNQLINGELSVLSKVNALEAAEYVAQFFDDVTAEENVRDRLPETSIRSMIYRMLEDSYTPIELLRIDSIKKCKSDPFFSSIVDELDAGKSAIDAIAGVDTKKVAELNTMFAVSYLMSHNKGIRKAMTYNYDPLVQEHMLDLYGIDRGGILTHPGKWGKKRGKSKIDLREIYHVHGFVAGERHENRDCPEVFPSDSGLLVLSEDSYYRIEREEAYNWSSSIQSGFLNKYSCVFVGFSAEDYNFRRILRQMGRKHSDDRRAHYLILTIDDWINNTYEDVCHTCFKDSSEIDGDTVKKVSQDTVLLLQYILQCRAEYWKRFNIYPIWVTVSEIPQLLTSLIET
mgnify:CR=1 FL=1